MKNILIIFLGTLLQISCSNGQPYYPEQKSEISDDLYSKCIKKLKKAYEEDNYYSIAFNVASLKGSYEVVAANLQKAFNTDSTFCNTIYDLQNTADEGFYQSLYRYDTILFKSLLTKCDQRKNQTTYADYKIANQLRNEEFQRQQPQIDSNKVNYPLIAELTRIRNDDQDLRIKLNGMNLKEEDRLKWQKSQDSLDSVNLEKIKSILQEYGYPKPEAVGYELSKVPFFVIHHQPSLEVRAKYRPILEENCDDALMVMFDKRTTSLYK